MDSKSENVRRSRFIGFPSSVAPISMIVLVMFLVPTCSCYMYNYYPTVFTHFRVIKPCSPNGSDMKAMLIKAFWALHNDFRRKVALGIKLFNMTYDDSPRLMSGMTYDCDLEEVARRLLSHEGPNYQQLGIAVNHHEGLLSNINSWIYELLGFFYRWTNETESRQRLMIQYAPRMGCAYEHRAKHGQNFMKLVCVYEYDRARFEKLVHEPSGNPCNKTNDCKEFGQVFECENNLCFAPLETVVKS